MIIIPRMLARLMDQAFSACVLHAELFEPCFPAPMHGSILVPGDAGHGRPW